MKNTGERYDWQGMVIITVLMIIGISIIYFTWDGMEINLENFYNYIYKNGMVLIFSLFFIGVGLYCWKMFFNNVIIKPKKETLYLKNIENDIYSFIDSKGKKYMYTSIDTREFNLGKYYTVMKTKDTIKEILEISNDNFPIRREKISFWLNWYSPIGNFENIFLLPILYIIFLPGFLSFIMSEGFNRIYGLIFMSVPGVFIVYDIVYKIKRSKIIEKIEKNPNIEYKKKELNKIGSNSELSNMQEKGLVGLYLLQPIAQIIGGLIFSGICGWIFKDVADNIIRIVIIPFLICGLAILISGIVAFVSALNEVNIPATKQNSDEYKNKQRKYYNLSNSFSKLCVVGFLLFWVGILVVWCYLTIKEKAYTMTLFSIPFWIAGIAVAYKNFKK